MDAIRGELATIRAGYERVAGHLRQFPALKPGTYAAYRAILKKATEGDVAEAAAVDDVAEAGATGPQGEPRETLPPPECPDLPAPPQATDESDPKQTNADKIIVYFINRNNEMSSLSDIMNSTGIAESSTKNVLYLERNNKGRFDKIQQADGRVFWRLSEREWPPRSPA